MVQVSVETIMAMECEQRNHLDIDHPGRRIPAAPLMATSAANRTHTIDAILGLGSQRKIDLTDSHHHHLHHVHHNEQHASEYQVSQGGDVYADGKCIVIQKTTFIMM